MSEPRAIDPVRVEEVSEPPLHEREPGKEVHQPLTWQQRRCAEILGMTPLGPMTRS